MAAARARRKGGFEHGGEGVEAGERDDRRVSVRNLQSVERCPTNHHMNGRTVKPEESIYEISMLHQGRITERKPV
jgi:hypothetical protein